MSTKKICDLSSALKKASSEAHGALISLHLVHHRWTPELAAYLREEDPGIPTTKEEVSDLLAQMTNIALATRKLNRHVNELCFDLQRVERGESFSV